MSIRATKDSSFAISNVYEQEVADTDWVNVIPKLEHKPLTLDLGDGVGKPIESTATSLVSYGDSGLMTTGDYVKTYNATDGVVDGEVGTTTTTTSTTGTHDIFADGSAVATYNLDGNALDLGGTYNGTATDVTYGTGKFEQAAVFNSTSARINSAVVIGATSSFSFWVKYDVLDLYDRTIEGSTSSNFMLGGLGIQPCGVYVNGAYALRGETDGNGVFATDTTSWNHIVITDDGIEVKWYKNGNLMVNANAGVYASLNGKLFTSIGLYTPNTSKNFKGSIDQVRIFNRALTAGEVTSLYNEQAIKYTSDITALGLTTAPTKAWLGDTKLSTVIETTTNRCQAQDIPLAVTGTPTTTTATGTSTISGLLTTADTVKLDANLVTTSSVVETDLGGGLFQYALTYPTQDVAPTTITVPNRAEESTVATETYDTINDKLIKTYNVISQSGRFLKYRVDGDTDNSVQKVQLDLFKGAI